MMAVRFQPVRTLASVVAKGRPGGARPATEAVGAARRLPSGARLHGPAHNSLRSLRSLRSDRMRQKCLRSALRARAVNPALLGASHAGRAPPGRPFAATSEGARRTPTRHPERQAVPRRRAVCGAEQRSLKGGARSALRYLTCRICLSAVSVANEASYAARPSCEQRRAVGAQHRPPQPARLRGTACRDALRLTARN